MDKGNRSISTAEAGPATRGRITHTFRALRHRNFQLFFTGQIISLTGTWMQSVAQSWLVYRITGSVALLGLIGFASQIPVFLLAPIGGAVADRYDRRKILVATQSTSMITAFVLAALTLTGHIETWHLFVLASINGVTNAFDIPTRQSFVVEMVGKEDLLNAIALNSSMFNGARIVGPAIAGILVSAVGEGWCFLGNAVSYIAVIIGLLLIRVVQAPRSGSSASAVARIKEGFTFVARTMPIRALLLLLGLVSLMGMPYAVLMPIFADQILNGGVRGLGILMGASGTGALIAALTLASRKGIKGLGLWVAVSSGVFGVFLILFSFSTSFWLSAALLVPVGFSMMLQMSSSNTLVQSMVPDELRGRVMAVYSMMFMGMAPIGALLSGSVANYLGAPATVAIGGSVCILGSLLFARKLPVLRHEARQIIVAMQMTGGEPASKASFQQPALARGDIDR
jgi:MFS family permease